MMTNLTPTTRIKAALLALFVVFMTACKPEIEASNEAVKDVPIQSDTVSVMSDSVNFSHEREIQYTLFDLSKTPAAPVGGGIVEALASGGEKACCLSLPKVWHAGMKVRIDWGEADLKQIYPERYSRTLEIPHYDQPADVYVVFYAKHEVEVVASVGEPGSPKWAGRVKQTPWDQCVADFGRKPCFWALPKQFDIGSSQGACTFSKSKDYPKRNLSTDEYLSADEYCTGSMRECMKDYEDEPFCNGILWGARRK